MDSRQRNREEAVNTQLAVLISKLGVTADAETIHAQGKHRPDVLLRLHGLRVAIEAKFRDHPKAEDVVLDDARNRVRSGIAHIAVAVVYPDALRSKPTSELVPALERSQLKYRILSEAHEGDEWFEGTPASLMDALRRVHGALSRDDVVARTAKGLSTQLEGVAQLWMGQEGACDRLCDILGIPIPKAEKPEVARSRRETAAKVSALVLANAFIFQEQLAAANKNISSLRTFHDETDLVGATTRQWKRICEINYVAIFQLGQRILNQLPSSGHTRSAVKALLAEAISICNQQTALRHDLMGRIYHWLLHNAKYLGTYYTSVSAATLLMKLVMAEPWTEDFGDPDSLASFKVADLACGTGTLLMAAAQAISDEYIIRRYETGESLQAHDLSAVHKVLMEHVLHGYDVLPTAVHLTASTLAMLAPEVAFVHMALYVMPLGMDRNKARLGSLDFLTSSEVQTQMALDHSQIEATRTGVAASYASKATVPKLDLCVMNPPFVRSVGGNLLFGSLPDNERTKLQTELKRQVSSIGASATAGLGSVFIALADQLLKPGGRLAFVVPAAIASGEAWGQSRKLIAERYQLETVIASHDAERPNFSENTDLSEVLFIARKLKSRERRAPTRYINLWRNPRSIHDAIDLANRIEHVGKSTSIAGRGFTSIPGTAEKLGEIVSVPGAKDDDIWIGALFAQTELLRIAWHLEQGNLVLPGNASKFSLPLVPLEELGELGYDRRDIHDAFEHSLQDWSPYPSFWNHEADKVTTISQQPTGHLIARTTAAKGRKLKSAAAVWSKAGDILLVERLRTNTHRVIGTKFDEPVLGNTWWAFKSKSLSSAQEKCLLLWLNSAISVLLFFSHRVTTEGAWMQMKKPAWEAMFALDVRSLNENQLAALGAAYDELSTQPLAPLAQLATDPVRQKIDDAISDVLHLPSFRSIRELLAREPGLTGGEINPRTTLDLPPSDKTEAVPPHGFAFEDSTAE